MSNINRFLFIFIINCLSVYYANATHIIGGELNYKCLGNNKYEISLTVYRDCYYGNPQAQFDNPAYIGVFSKTSSKLLDSLKIDFVKDDTLKVQLSDTCLVVPKDVCVHTTTYKSVITLNPLAGGYILAYQRCCRNQTIQNIIDPLSTGATFLVEISDDALKTCNSNAKFSNWPPIFICVNEKLTFDHSAKDIDGDSIFYKLCTPFEGANTTIPQPKPANPPPYLPVQWKTPYDLLNILGGEPLNIDGKTGYMTAKPSVIGQFVVGVCIDEFRNKKLISTTRRDFQYNVGYCTSSVAAFFAPKIQCNNLDVFFDNQSKNASKYEWDFGDKNSTTDVSTLAAPSYAYPDTGTYKIRLIAQPGGACADTSYQTIILKNSTIKVAFNYDLTGCDTILLKTINQTTDAAGLPKSYKWSLLQQNGTFKLESTDKEPTFKVGKSGNWVLTLEATAANDCPIQLAKIINITAFDPPLLASFTGCKGDTITLNPTPNSIYDYIWSPSSDFVMPNLATQKVVLKDNKTVSVKIKQKTGVCEVNRKVTLNLNPKQINALAIAKPDTIYAGKTAQLETNQGLNYAYIWSPKLGLDKPTIYNPIAKPAETITYKVSITSAGECSGRADVTIYVIKPICDEPFIFVPTGFTPNNDGRNDELFVRGNYIEKLVFAVYNRWGERVFFTEDIKRGWDGTYNGAELPPDVYGFYLKVTCPSGENFSKQGNVTLIR